MSFIEDFKEFAFKGNLIDMAVGLVMGGAVAAVVKSFLDNIITPLISMVMGVPDLSTLTYEVGGKIGKVDAAGQPVLGTDGTQIMEAAAIKYGTFLQNCIDFFILALVIFIALKIVSRWMKTAADEAPPSDEVVLLTEIRDSLKK